MFKKSVFKIDLVIILIIFFINIALHLYSLDKIVYTNADEGVYLYSAKLMAEGYIPYKDFFLAHPFFGLLPVVAIFILTNFDLNIFHIIYISWSFSIIFPLYFISLKLTKSRFAAIFCIILLATFTELVIADMRFFAFRQVSQPLLGWSLFFLFVKGKPKLSGIFLGIFALIIIQNLLLSICLIFSLIIYRYKNIKVVLLQFFIICLIGYLIILTIPGAMSNIITYQMNRPPVPYKDRLESFINITLPNSFPIVLGGLGGSVLAIFLKRPIGLFNILGLFATVFISSSYYPFYISILTCGLVITSAILVAYLNRNLLTRLTLILIIISLIYISSYSNLKYFLIDNKTPKFFETVRVLEKTNPPLFTFEPIYGLYSKKDLTFHYHVADMRYFRVQKENLSENAYIQILSKSNTVLLEPFANSLISRSVLEYIKLNFSLVYKSGDLSIYARR